MERKMIPFVWVVSLFLIIISCFCIFLSLNSIKLCAERDEARHALAEASHYTTTDNSEGLNVSQLADQYSNDTSYGKMRLMCGRVYMVSDSYVLVEDSNGWLWELDTDTKLDLYDSVMLMIGDSNTPQETRDDKIVRLWVELGA